MPVDVIPEAIDVDAEDGLVIIRTWLTPQSARDLAKLLTDAADKAEPPTMPLFDGDRK